MGTYGRTSASLDGTLSGTLTTPVRRVSFSRSDSISDSVTGFGDLLSDVLGALECGRQQLYDLHHRGHSGRRTDSTRLANIGIGHGAVDGGLGYTYFNPKTGQELSGVLGFTYNIG